MYIVGDVEIFKIDSLNDEVNNDLISNLFINSFKRYEFSKLRYAQPISPSYIKCSKIHILQAIWYVTLKLSE